jgi:hypothetical protein
VTEVELTPCADSSVIFPISKIAPKVAISIAEWL